MSLDIARGKVALVDDDRDFRSSIAQVLSLSGFDVAEFASGTEALAALDASWECVVVSDVRMPGVSGIELFRRLQRIDPELPVIMVTGHGDITMAVDALKGGAWDFLTKPFSPDDLLAAVDRAQRARSLAIDNRRLKAEAVADFSSLLVGQSGAITRLRGMIPALADTDLDVLIEGETGTGKELFARLLHRAGRRSRHRLLSVACASLPQALEEELFAPTGRSSLASANRGTLILDDLDLASTRLQDRLVRVAEDRVLHSPGGREPIPLDIRIIASAGTGSRKVEDSIVPALFYRVAAVRLSMPPLRERREDVPGLFAHHVGLASARLRRPIPAMTADVRDFLQTHEWPGNVRELAHYAERFVLGLVDEKGAREAGQPSDSLSERLETFERTAIIQAIIDANFEIGTAIERLGLPRKTFYYRVGKLRINLAELRKRRHAGRQG